MRQCGCRAQLVANRRARSLSAVIPRRYRGVSFDRPARDRHARARRSTWCGATCAHSTSDSPRAAGCGSSATSEPARRRSRCSSPRRRWTAGAASRSTRCPRLLAEIRSTFDDPTPGAYTEFLSRLAEVDLLHLDDVGAEKTSPWVLEQLYAIVNDRYEAERAVVITTNLDRDALAEQIGERTVSRLEEMCEVCPLFGRDHRRFEAVDRRLGPMTRHAPCRQAQTCGSPEPPRPTLRPRHAEHRRSWAPSGATRARARSSTCSPSSAAAVVRFQGGNNAGHTIVRGDETFKFHLIPSGILYPGTHLRDRQRRRRSTRRS